MLPEIHPERQKLPGTTLDILKMFAPHDERVRHFLMDAHIAMPSTDELMLAYYATIRANRRLEQDELDDEFKIYMRTRQS